MDRRVARSCAELSTPFHHEHISHVHYMHELRIILTNIPSFITYTLIVCLEALVLVGKRSEDLKVTFALA